MYWTLTWGVCAWAAASSCSRAPKSRRRRRRGAAGGGGPRQGGRAAGGTRARAAPARRRRRARLTPARLQGEPPHERTERADVVVARRAVGALGDERASNCARACGGQLASSRATSGRRRLRRRRQLEQVQAGVEAEAEAEAGRRRAARQPLHRLDVLIHLDGALVGDERQRHLGAALDAEREEAVVLGEGEGDGRRRQRDARQLERGCVRRRAALHHEQPVDGTGWTVVLQPHHRPGPSDDHWSEGEARLKASTCWRARSSSSSMVR